MSQQSYQNENLNSLISDENAQSQKIPDCKIFKALNKNFINENEINISLESPQKCDE